MLATKKSEAPRQVALPRSSTVPRRSSGMRRIGVASWTDTLALNLNSPCGDEARFSMAPDSAMFDPPEVTLAEFTSMRLASMESEVAMPTGQGPVAAQFEIKRLNGKIAAIARAGKVVKELRVLDWSPLAENGSGAARGDLELAALDGEASDGEIENGLDGRLARFCRDLRLGHVGACRRARR